ncbi:NUDIX hydrolase [Kordiimonas sp. SCSIO 12610]|uniref:NUDIX hydrolase n=1 Tax=Kordiimonas sp. SCSIO 12610 TaxID=2829597 RepID=UPI00210DFF15|nr:NUDIX domain-containing protein [Kordiimonas sp. SCSIO 12610]UTW54080.1 NUDIX domain-containing protein [Kordiimonas sp. SCSIO 12610]
MGFNTTYRLSAHAVIVNEHDEVLLLKASYGNRSWGLPGGALEKGETIHEALYRECREELGIDVHIEALTGVYYHSVYESHVFIFLCSVPDTATRISLSEEHTDYRFWPLAELSSVQKLRVMNALNFDGIVKSESF